MSLWITAAAVLAGTALLFGVYRYWNGNFHTVLRGRLYRSAQPSADQLRRWHERIGFRTILNLRGAHPEWPSYRAEKAFADAHGIRLIDYPIGARRALQAHQIEELVTIFRDSEGPILVHCQSGADRSALVSALFAASAGRSDLFARWQLMPWYGHWPLPFLRAYAMDRTFAEFRQRRRRTDS